MSVATQVLAFVSFSLIFSDLHLQILTGKSGRIDERSKCHSEYVLGRSMVYEEGGVGQAQR